MKIKRLFMKTLMICMLLLLGSSVFSMPVSAESKYTVSEIQANGSLRFIGGFEDFYQAEAEMKKYPNGVMQANFSYSRTKYVAMTRGIAVSYAFRRSIGGDYLTMPIYQYEPGKNVKNAKSTYVVSHHEMEYFNTVWNSEDGWMVHVNLGGFDGYAYLQQVDLIPYIYFENNLPIDLGGGSLEDPSERFTIRPEKAYFTVRNGEFRFVRHSLFNGRLMMDLAMAPADQDWMQEGGVYYTNDYIHYYTDIACTQNEHTYYNYYMFLPVRSKSYCDPATFDNYIQNVIANSKSVLYPSGSAQVFFDCQDRYGVNALLLYSLATHESNFGISEIARSKYNLFGWSAYDADTGAATEYANVADCVNQMASLNLRKYLETDSSLFFGAYFGSKGSGFNVKYASDPYWGLEVACRAYMFDKMNGLVDYRNYRLGVVNDSNGFKEPFRTSPSASSAVSFYANYGSTYQKDHVLILNGEENGFYQLQSSSDLNADKSLPAYDRNTNERKTYNFLNSVLYVDKSKVNVISESRYSPAGVTMVVNGSLLSGGDQISLSNFTYGKSGINLSGYGYQKGISSRASSDIVHELVLKDANTSQEYVFPLSNTSYNTNESHKDMAYEYTGFSASGLKITGIPEGKYEMILRLRYPKVNYVHDESLQFSRLPDTSEVSELERFVREDGKIYFIYGTIRLGAQPSTGSVKSIYWNGSQLHISGTAVIQGVTHSDRDRISRKLILTEINTKKEITFDLNVYSHEDGIEGAYEYSLMDGVNYKYAWYDQEIDLSALEEGDYRARILTTVNDGKGTEYSGETSLSQSQIGYVPERITLETNGLQKVISIDKVIRELSVYEINVDLLEDEIAQYAASVNKPTFRNTNYSLFEAKLDEGTLSLKGYLYLYGVDHTAENQPVYDIYLVQNGSVVCKERMSLAEEMYSIDDLLEESEFSYSSCWFETAMDLSSLSAGEYELYISEEITQDGTQYHEFFHLYDSYHEFARKTDRYEIRETEGNGRMYLIVS